MCPVERQRTLASQPLLTDLRAATGNLLSNWTALRPTVESARCSSVRTFCEPRLHVARLREPALSLFSGAKPVLMAADCTARSKAEEKRQARSGLEGQSSEPPKQQRSCDEGVTLPAPPLRWDALTRSRCRASRPLPQAGEARGLEDEVALLQGVEAVEDNHHVDGRVGVGVVDPDEGCGCSRCPSTR